MMRTPNGEDANRAQHQLVCRERGHLPQLELEPGLGRRLRGRITRSVDWMPLAPALGQVLALAMEQLLAGMGTMDNRMALVAVMPPHLARVSGWMFCGSEVIVGGERGVLDCDE